MKNEKIICKLCSGSPDIELYKIPNKNILTDVCIGKEIELLICNGINTYGCCCGHGESEPICLIDEKDREKAKQLGYDYIQNYYIQDGIFSGSLIIKLKTDVQKELRNVLKDKVWRYIHNLRR